MKSRVVDERRAMQTSEKCKTINNKHSDDNQLRKEYELPCTHCSRHRPQEYFVTSTREFQASEGERFGQARRPVARAEMRAYNFEVKGRFKGSKPQQRAR